MIKLMNFFRTKKIFFDYASATPMLPEAVRVMEKYYYKSFYNSGAIYSEAEEVKKDIEECRAKIARIVGAQTKEIIFTSGGTESDNLAILGVLEKAFKKIKKPKLIISSIEHPAVFSVGEEWVRRGGSLSIVGVDNKGRVDMNEFKQNLNEEVALVSIGLVNSEIGVIQPISKIGRMLKEMRRDNKSEYPLLHSDASAGAYLFNTNIESLQCDLMTLDSAKIYGPKGVGILALRHGVEIHPMLFGGGQERGRRPGTLSPALIAGMAKAMEINEKDKERELKRVSKLRSIFLDIVSKKLPNSIINGPEIEIAPNILSITVPKVLGEFLVIKMEREGVLASVGSACSYDEKISGSPVIRALGNGDYSESTIRFSFGRQTTLSSVKRGAEIFCRISQNMVK